MQIIIPMSGFGERFRSAGYTVPKPLIVVDGKPAIRISDEQSDSQIVHVLVGNDDVLTLMLFIPEDQGSNSLREDWLYLLSTLVFDDKDSSLSNSVSSGSGSINGMPCGGPAGILCPDGKYCDIYDIESDIGRCVSL